MHGGTGARTIERVGGALMTAGRPGGRTAGLVMLMFLLAVWPSGRLAAQDTTTVRDTTHLVLPSDTLPKGVRPMGAFWRSFLIPGWGQAVTGRHTTGAVFV